MSDFIYHEMLVHPGVIGTSPKKVLILGGDDGCALREVVRYPKIKRIKLIEIEEMIYEEETEEAFSDKRVEVVYSSRGSLFKDAFDNEDTWDLIIMDLPSLFSPSFFERIKDKLTQNGCLAIQTGGINYDATTDMQKMHVQIIKNLKQTFELVDIAYEYVPSFEALCAVAFASNRYRSFKKEVRHFIDLSLHQAKIIDLKFYNGKAHRRIFTPSVYLQGLY